MRICDKCHTKHASHKVRTRDICDECLVLLDSWFNSHPLQDGLYHIEETLSPDKTVISRKLMIGDKVIDPRFGLPK